MKAVGPDGEPIIRASFVGFVPVEAPRWVVHVQIDTHDLEAYGGNLAAPFFARLIESLLRDC